MRLFRPLPPALVLFILSPVVAELLSGTLTPREFFNPGMLLLSLTFYGSGSILIRERLICWNKGWPSLLVLGAAYAILEEGLMVKCFFNPDWPGLGLHGAYGRLAGVNWFLVLRLMIYHSLISIAIPIVFVQLMYPARRKASWIPGWSQALFVALLAAGVAVGFRLTPYRPPLVPYLLAWLVFILLIVLARRLPRQPFQSHARPKVRPKVRPIWFLLLGFVSVLCFVLVSKLPDTRIPFGVALLMTAGLIGLILGLVLWLSGNGGSWTARHRYALGAGALWFFVIFLLLSEMDHKGDVKHQGKALVALEGLVFLLAMARQARYAERLEIESDSRTAAVETGPPGRTPGR